VEESVDAVTVTWVLGDNIPGPAHPEYFGYGVDYDGPDGSGGKRFGVRFSTTNSAHVFDWTSNTQANYAADSITIVNDRVVVFYRDADIGLSEVGTIRAFAHVNGSDKQTGLAVTLLH
jgi:hypothetical protein